MNPKTTNVLLVLLLVVGAYFVFVERDAPTTHERQETAAQQKTSDGTAVFTAQQLSTESVVSVTIQRGSEPVVVLEKEGQDWFQTQPVRFPLNTWSAKQVIDDVAGLRYTRRFMPAQSDSEDLPTLKQASLSPPLATVTLQSESPESTTTKVILGRKAVGARAYVMFSDDLQVYVVNHALHRQVLDGRVADWRQRSIGAPTEGQVQRLVLSRLGKDITVQKSQGNWLLDRPDSGRADTEQVKGLLATMGGLYIEKFVADNPEDRAVYGLDQPRVELRVHMTVAQNKASATQPDDDTAATQTSSPSPVVKVLRIGAPVDLKEGAYFATWGVDGDSSVVFTVSASEVDKFAKSVDDLRDARITPIEPVDIRQLTVQRPSQQTIKLDRGPDGWSFVTPQPGFDPDSGWVSALVEQIAQTKAQAYRQQAGGVTDTVLATVTLGAVGRSEPEILRIFPQDQQDTFAVRRNQETTLYLVPKARFNDLFEPLTGWRQRMVLGLTADTVQRIAINHADGRRYVFERTASSPGAANPTSASAADAPTQTVWGPWRLADQDRFETEAFDRLVAELLPVRAERWLTDSADEPSAAPTTLQLTTADGQTHTLVVDPVKRRGKRIGLSQDGQWFELGHRLIKLLGGEFRLRTILPVGISEIESVQLIRPGGSLTIKPDANGQYSDLEGKAVDASIAGGLFDTLAGLRAERFISPEHIQEPPLKIVVKVTSGQTYRLAFAAPQDGRYVVTDGERWFTLDTDTYDKLDASWTDDSSEHL